MNKDQKEARARNVEVLARNFPAVDAAKLQNDLYRLALSCEANAIDLCGTPGHVDKRDDLRARAAALFERYKIDCGIEVTGDPRGYCLKLHLPDGSYNTWGGKEAGYGIGSL